MDLLLNHVEDGRVEFLDFLDPINATERRWLEESLDEGHLWREAIIHQRHPVSAKLDIEPGTMSPEFLNLAMALCVIAVRYPSVFWAANKSFGFIFSLQLIFSGVTSLVVYSASTVLYKVHVYGPERALLRYPTRLSLDVLQSAFFTGLYMLSLLASSVVLYAYGHQKYSEWSERQLMRSHITARSSRSRLWGFFPHFMAFVSLMLIALCAIPMMYDLILVYCGSLDSAALIGATAIALHLLLWILLWLGLTLKNSWNFATEVNLPSSEPQAVRRQPRKGDTPLLVIDHGQTYQIREVQSKQAIRNLAHTARFIHPPHVQSPGQDLEDIYWLRPKPPTPVGEKKAQDDEEAANENSKSLSWLRKKKQSPSKKKPAQDERPGSAKVKRKNSFGNLLKNAKKDNDLNEAFSDDGDYATLRQIVIRDETDDNLAKATHMSLCPLKEEQDVQTHVFAPASQGAGRMNGDYELLVEHKSQPQSPRLFTPEPIYGQRRAFAFSAAQNATYQPLKVQTHSEQLAQRLDRDQPLGSISSESSNSPEKASDTSSGIHSGSSPNSSFSEKRSASAENLMKALATTRATWKSSSLQRTCGPPIEVKCPRVNFIPENPYQIGDDLPPPLDESTMVIRRSRRPQTEINCGNGNSNFNVFSRTTNMRMTSFTENAEAENFMRNNALPFPPQPRSLFDSEMRATPVDSSPYGTYVPMCQSPRHPMSPVPQHFHQNPIKPVVSIAPQQLPPYPSTTNSVACSMDGRDSANYSVCGSTTGESEFIVQLQKNFL